jgi:hypothetical protein
LVNSETAGLDVVTSVGDRFDGAFAHQLLQDCLVLLDSPLSGRDVEILWLAGTFRDFDLERLGIDGRVWLRRIADICTDRIRRNDPFMPDAAGDCRWLVAGSPHGFRTIRLRRGLSR